MTAKTSPMVSATIRKPQNSNDNTDMSAERTGMSEMGTLKLGDRQSGVDVANPTLIELG